MRFAARQVGWLDLRARKLVAPPPTLLAVLAQDPRAPGFFDLPPHATSKTHRKD